MACSFGLQIIFSSFQEAFFGLIFIWIFCPICWLLYILDSSGSNSLLYFVFHNCFFLLNLCPFSAEFTGLPYWLSSIKILLFSAVFLLFFLLTYLFCHYVFMVFNFPLGLQSSFSSPIYNFLIFEFVLLDLYFYQVVRCKAMVMNFFCSKHNSLFLVRRLASHVVLSFFFPLPFLFTLLVLVWL